MAVNKGFEEIGNDLLSQIASDDQDHNELGTDTNDQGNDDDLLDPKDKFQNEFEDNNDNDSDDNDPSDLGSDAPKDRPQPKDKPQVEDKSKPTGAVEDIWDAGVRLKQDRAGNLLNSAGQIVVRAGRERKFFEDAKKRVVQERTDNVRLAGNMQKIAAAAKELHTRYATLQEQKGMFDRAGLNNDEQLQMLQIATEFKKNPVDGIKKMLTMAHLQGVDLKTLGVAGGIDARTIAEEIKKTVSDQLRPITERESATTADRERLAEAKEVATKFFTDNPDALEAREEMGSDKFNQMIFGAKQRFPDMSLSEIWLRIKLAANNAPNADREQNNRQQQNNRRPTGDVNDRRPPRRPRTTGSESFADIGASVLRDLQSSLRN